MLAIAINEGSKLEWFRMAKSRSFSPRGIFWITFCPLTSFTRLNRQLEGAVCATKSILMVERVMRLWLLHLCVRIIVNSLGYAIKETAPANRIINTQFEGSGITWWWPNDHIAPCIHIIVVLSQMKTKLSWAPYLHFNIRFMIAYCTHTEERDTKFRFQCNHRIIKAPESQAGMRLPFVQEFLRVANSNHRRTVYSSVFAFKIR